ncbi:unnamed protein product [Closterium sp. Naga37s-1]|nr:unnamed protein product [Closterium sp. Naga37s-1]
MLGRENQVEEQQEDQLEGAQEEAQEEEPQEEEPQEEEPQEEEPQEEEPQEEEPQEEQHPLGRKQLSAGAALQRTGVADGSESSSAAGGEKKGSAGRLGGRAIGGRRGGNSRGGSGAAAAGTGTGSGSAASAAAAAAAAGAGSVGRWVHVDGGRGVVDGEEKVEGLLMGMSQPLTYVVGLAGGGAKDVTRRDRTHPLCPLLLRSLNSDLTSQDGVLYSLLLAAPALLQLRCTLVTDLACQGRSLVERPPCPANPSAPFSVTPPLPAPVLASSPPPSSVIPLPVSAASATAAGTAGPARRIAAVVGAAVAAPTAAVATPAEGGAAAAAAAAPPPPPRAAAAAWDERAAAEDMEMDVKQLTEPLPSNQQGSCAGGFVLPVSLRPLSPHLTHPAPLSASSQAYRSHPLCVLERWLGAYPCLRQRPCAGGIILPGIPQPPSICVGAVTGHAYRSHPLYVLERWLGEYQCLRRRGPVLGASFFPVCYSHTARTLPPPPSPRLQAYRSHPLYVLERWLGAYQCLRPRGPVLGVCGGEAVFPRACVQQLRSRHQWLKEGRRVRDGETPVKTVSFFIFLISACAHPLLPLSCTTSPLTPPSQLTRKPPTPRAVHRRNPYQSRTHILPHECFPSHVAARMRATARAGASGGAGGSGGGRMGGAGSTAAEDEDAAAAAVESMDGRGEGAAAGSETGAAGAGRATGDEPSSSSSTITIELFGEWQTDTWRPPPAVDGRIPKNERGQVEVWSEKCLPPGTVHLRLPRLVTVVQRLGFDFAPAVVGFEWKGGKATPKYEGLVVCAEHADTIVDVSVTKGWGGVGF